jgi:hypothetical protein
MRTTDFTDNTDEEQRQISTGEFIPPLGRMRSHAADLNQFAIPPKGGFKAIFIRFFISGIGVIRGRLTPPFCCG